MIVADDLLPVAGRWGDHPCKMDGHVGPDRFRVHDDCKFTTTAKGRLGRIP